MYKVKLHAENTNYYCVLDSNNNMIKHLTGSLINKTTFTYAMAKDIANGLRNNDVVYTEMFG